MHIVLIDYGSGNLHSATKAIQRVAPEGAVVRVISDPHLIDDASHVILPGVGAFADCMAGLVALDGMVDVLHEHAMGKARPFLGICVGMQLLAKIGYEHGKTEGLGWLDADVVRIEPKDAALKIPHMGWNTLDALKPEHAMLHELGDEAHNHMYFVHSYQMRCHNPHDVVATTPYGDDITAIVARDNIVGVQFHPEKSQRTGMQILENFLNM